jgi:hypothetical protein
MSTSIKANKHTQPAGPCWMCAVDRYPQNIVYTQRREKEICLCTSLGSFHLTIPSAAAGCRRPFVLLGSILILFVLIIHSSQETGLCRQLSKGGEKETL